MVSFGVQYEPGGLAQGVPWQDPEIALYVKPKSQIQVRSTVLRFDVKGNTGPHWTGENTSLIVAFIFVEATT